MLLQDLRYACRTLRSRPLSAAVAVLSLALGIGVNTAVFTIADQVLLRSLPVRAPEQVVNVTGGDTNSYPIYREFRDRNQVFDGFLAASTSRKAALRAGNAETEVVNLRLVSGNFFGTLGVGTAVGRPIQESDDTAPGASPVAVVSYGLWTRLFARNPAALGSPVSINGYPLRVVGVVERGFHGLEAGQETDVYVPIHMTGQIFPSFAKGWTDAGWHWLWTMGRLKPGVTPLQAQAALNTLAPHIAAAVKRPTMDKNLPPVEVSPGAQGTPFLRRELERPVLVLMCLTGLVLLIACANVANLWLAGAAARQREIAIREAVGAGRWRLMRQLLTESAVVAVLGGTAGLLLASWISDFLAILIAGTRDTFRIDSSLDPRVLAFTGTVSIITGLLFGFVPAWRGSRSSVMQAMRPTGISTTGGRTFGARLLASAQVALSVILLVGAGLFARTLGNLRGIDATLAREHVLLVDVQPADLGYSGQRLRLFYDSLAERARSHPGVVAASLSVLTPLSGRYETSTMAVEGTRPGRAREHYVTQTSAGYFATMGIPMLAGRDFLPEDEPVVADDGDSLMIGVSSRSNTPPALAKVRRVAILSESLARRFFGSVNAVGRRVCYGDEFRPGSGFEIVGVVKDVRYGSAKSSSIEIMYTPNWIEGAGWRSLAVRSAGDPNALVAALRADLRALDPAVPIHKTITLDAQLDGWLSSQRLLAYLSTGFGLLAALLAAIGLYGVLANGVARRTKEIGIRMAMGADRRSVLAMVLRESGAVALGGTAAGLAGAALLTRLVAKLLYGVKPLEPLVFAGAAVLLLTVCIAAAWAPARRAASVDPIHALRYE